jgi:hypothetical protein
MVEQDKKRFVEIMTFIGTVYSKELSTEQLKAWFRVLEDLDVGDIETAADAHMRESRFMPTPAELRKKLEPQNRQMALIAWAEVPGLLRNSRAAKSADPVTERVVQDLGGWVALGQKTADQLVWIEKEFATRYEMYAELGTDVTAISGPRKGLRLVGTIKQDGGMR